MAVAKQIVCRIQCHSGFKWLARRRRGFFTMGVVTIVCRRFLLQGLSVVGCNEAFNSSSGGRVVPLDGFGSPGAPHRVASHGAHHLGQSRRNGTAPNAP